MKRTGSAAVNGAMRWLLQRRQWVLVAAKCWGFGYWINQETVSPKQYSAMWAHTRKEMIFKPRRAI